jgi:preprotein translocase subunit SecE
MNALTTYLQNVRMELTHVVWPTTRQAVMYTLIIIVVSAVVALIIAGLDYIFTGAVNYAVSRGL